MVKLPLTRTKTSGKKPNGGQEQSEQTFATVGLKEVVGKPRSLPVSLLHLFIFLLKRRYVFLYRRPVLMSVSVIFVVRE